jgi:group I intron endonuclease
MHFNLHLQRARNRDGEEALVFETVENCAEKDTLKLEQEMIDALISTVGTVGMYNSARNTSAPTKGMMFSEEIRRKISDGNKGKKRSEETRSRMRLAQNGRKVSGQARINISKSKSGSKHPNWGKHLTFEVKANISAGSRGRTLTPQHSANVRRASRSRRTSKLTEQIVQQIRADYVNGNYTQVELGKKYGVSDSYICMLINGTRWFKCEGEQ